MTILKLVFLLSAFVSFMRALNSPTHSIKDVLCYIGIVLTMMLAEMAL